MTLSYIKLEALELACRAWAKTDLWIRGAGEADSGLKMPQQQPNTQPTPQGIWLSLLLPLVIIACHSYQANGQMVT